MNLNLSIIILSLVGLLLSASIMRKKKTKDCGSFCSYDVIGSRYSKTLGIENTLLGGAYYLFLAGAYTLFWLAPSLVPVSKIGLVSGAIGLAAFGAMAFSLYLVGIQIFVLKKYCLLCLTTAITNIVLAHLIIL